MSEIREILLLALESLRKNKLRSFLTILGVVIGVATVIGMSSIISGLNNNISSQIQDLGSNLIFVQRIAPTIGGRMSPDVFSRKKLTLEDAKAIGELPTVKAVAPLLRVARLRLRFVSRVKSSSRADARACSASAGAGHARRR